jgi:hypothetical protein
MYSLCSSFVHETAIIGLNVSAASRGTNRRLAQQQLAVPAPIKGAAVISTVWAASQSVQCA